LIHEMMLEHQNIDAQYNFFGAGLISSVNYESSVTVGRKQTQFNMKGQ